MPGVPSEPWFSETLGQSIPPNTPHAVSVSLPTWRSNVGYEEGEAWVLDKMQTGYPRFFIHKSIQRLAQSIVRQRGSPDTEDAMLFPTERSAGRCVNFLQTHGPNEARSRVWTVGLEPHPSKTPVVNVSHVRPRIYAVIYPITFSAAAKLFWQHTGEGVSSRRAEFCQKAFNNDRLIESRTVHDHTPSPPRLAKGPRRYQRSVDHGIPHVANGHAPADDAAMNGEGGGPDSAQFVEERFGRNLDVAFAAQAKLAIRKRIAGSLTAESDLPQSLDEPADSLRERAREVQGFSVDDVYLYSCGMNAIFNAHRYIRLARGEMKSVMFGFPYVDTLKILKKFGPGATFFGFANENDLDDLERRLRAGERYLALFCEFPGNPLLRSPDLKRLRALADQYGFAIVVDETIGNFLNVHVLPYADVVVSSLTKIFSGDSNVMGGCMILNPTLPHYAALKRVLADEYEDNLFEEDGVYLERNSRDYAARIARVNLNAEAIADVLRAHHAVKQVNYPKYCTSKANYDACRLPEGGYGGLLSATFHSVEDAMTFYDALECQKGPSLGTNFTLASPFVLLAHYGELEWAAKYGCEVSLVRFSVGLEETEGLRRVFRRALAAVELSRG